MTDQWLLPMSRRASTRRKITLPCQVVCEREFRILSERIVDLSLTGMLVESYVEPDPGSRVIVSFQAPKTRVWIDAEGVIARVDYARRFRDPGLSFAVQFVTLDGISRAVLKATLNGLPPPIPRRPVRVDYAASVMRA